MTARGLGVVTSVPGCRCPSAHYPVLNSRPPLYSDSQTTMTKKAKLADIWLQIYFVLSFQVPKRYHATISRLQVRNIKYTNSFK